MTDLLHHSVLLEEAIKSLQINPEENYVDATFGRGGYTAAILKQLTTGHLLSIDQDLAAITYGKSQFALPIAQKQLFLVQDNYEQIATLIATLDLAPVAGIVFDLGVSSPQLDDPQRGFSYRNAGPLDMRMDQSQDLTAFKIINTYSSVHLNQIFRDYGDAPCAWRVSQGIIQERQKKPIETTLELVQIISDYLPEAVKKKKGHPAKKFFQALRVEVNHETTTLEVALKKSLEVLKVGGVIAVVTFQPLEDRIVSQLFRKLARYQPYPKGIPIIPEEAKPQLELINHRAIRPSESELKQNRRAHSARLRSAKKIRNICFG